MLHDIQATSCNLFILFILCESCINGFSMNHHLVITEVPATHRKPDEEYMLRPKTLKLLKNKILALESHRGKLL